MIKFIKGYYYFLIFFNMEYIALIWTVTLIHFLALISPGPDFIMTVKNSLSYSRKTWIYTAIWLSFGMLIHIFYCIAGLALIISKSIIIFNIIKLLGAGYLIYIGLKSVFAKSSNIDVSDIKQKVDISSFEAIKMWFLTNVLNPKATLFFLSLFTFVVSPWTSKIILVIMSIIMVINTILWFSLVSIFFTHKKVRNIFDKFQWIFNKIFWWILIALWIKIAFSHK